MSARPVLGDRAPGDGATGQAGPERPRRDRLWEIDTLRGVAVVLMILYHLSWDLDYFDAVDREPDWAWQAFARFIGSSFSFLLGVSVVLSEARRRAARPLDPPSLGPSLRRAATLLGLGAVISAVTYVVVGSDSLVLFGILHLLGVALVLSALALRAPAWAALLAGLVVLALGVPFGRLHPDEPWLFVLGIRPDDLQGVDYYPLVPWAGFALVGTWVGRTLYPAGRRRLRTFPANPPRVARVLMPLGRHSLLIYLTHQPVLFGVLFLLGVAEL